MKYLRLAYKSELSDEDLLQDYTRSGTENSLWILLDRYVELTYGLCLKYLKNKEDAEDAALSIYEIIRKKVNDHEIESFRSWSYALSKNYCLQILRKRGTDRSKKISAHSMYSDEIFHPDNVDKEEQIQQLEACMVKLNANQRRCIDLFYFKKHTYAEIAEMENIKWHTVRSHIQNARRNLLTCMESRKNNE